MVTSDANANESTWVKIEENPSDGFGTIQNIGIFNEQKNRAQTT